MTRAVVAAVLVAGAVWAQASATKDQAIEREIARRLEKSAILSEGFQVSVKGGVAYWTGQTTVPQRKGAATRMAKSAGAARVVNNIRVLPARGAPPKSKASTKTGTKAPVPKAAAPEPPPPGPRKVAVEWKEVPRR